MISKFRQTLLVGALLCLGASPAGAAPVYDTPVDSFKHLTDKDAAGLVTKLKNGIATADISDHEFFREEAVARDKTGAVEQHNHWNDYIVIQNGEGTLVYGGTVKGARETQPGEWRGGTIEGGKTEPLHAGDLITIPAGTPHQFTLAAGKTIRYLTVKARQ